MLKIKPRKCKEVKRILVRKMNISHIDIPLTKNWFNILPVKY